MYSRPPNTADLRTEKIGGIGGEAVYGGAVLGGGTTVQDLILAAQFAITSHIEMVQGSF